MEDEEKQKEEVEESESNENIEESSEKSSTTSLLIITIIGILLLAGFYFIYSRNQVKDDSMNDGMTDTNMEEQVEPQSSDSMNEEMMESDSMMENVISVEGGNYYFKPNEIRVKRGEKVDIEFTNAGGTHDLVIDKLNVRSEMTETGDTVSISFTPDQAGEFDFYCSVGNHRALGMEGTLIVEE